MKKIVTLSLAGLLSASAPVVLTLAQPAALVAQQPQAPVSISGKVINPAGAPFTTGEVKLTTDKNKEEKDRVYAYHFPIGPDGTFKGAGIAPGDYLIVVFAENKVVDYQLQTFKAGDTKALNFDMTREEYQKAMTPEDKAALEAYKKRSAGVTSENAKIKDLNGTMLQALNDEKAGKADVAVTSLTSIVAANPPEPYQSIIYSSLGQAQLTAAKQAADAAKAAKTPMTPAIQQQYLDAAASFQKSVDLAPKSSKPIPPDTISNVYLNQGQAYAQGGKATEAAAAYDAAARTSPANAGAAYSNEAATLYNTSHLPEAATAADKAIAADPKKAINYYIKAQSLIPNATVDAKTQKIVAPPGCVEAYQEYLALDPTGSHATEVKELLTNLGQPVVNSFKASKKR